MVEALIYNGFQTQVEMLSTTAKIVFNPRNKMLDVMTPFGRVTAVPGQWIVRDDLAGSLHVVDDGAFQARHEPIST